MVEHAKPNAAQRLQADALDEVYRRRYGAAVEYLKQQVGAGERYGNEVATALVARDGAWFECVDLPMEFTGAAGVDVRCRFVSDEVMTALVDYLHDVSERVHAGNAREFGLFAIYSQAGIVDERHAFAYQFRQRRGEMLARPRRVGQFRPCALPRAFRCRMDVDLRLDEQIVGAPWQRGVIFGIADVGERNLVVYIPYEGQTLHDLGNRPPIPTAH